MNILERFEKPPLTEIRNAIDDADGSEVLFIGKLNDAGKIIEISVAARGDEKSVPALVPFMEKGDVVIHNHPSENLRPSEPDLRIASSVGNIGVGFYIIGNSLTEVYVVAEPVQVKEIKKLNIDELLNLFDPAGPIRGIMDYEVRDAQIQLTELVAKSFNDNVICVAEAGTGVGKSLAYLVPAFIWCKQNEERIVISTGTINLQQQLIEKDIPIVEKLTGNGIKSVLIKGRGNFLCIRRLNQTLGEFAFDNDEAHSIEMITQWAEKTKTGDISDLSFLPDEVLWSKICSEADTCVGIRCRHRDNCFVLRARKEAAGAQILIVNHHLLFADLGLRISGLGFDNTAVLPPFQRIIFDEAHNIEKNATSFFSKRFSRPAFLKQMNRLTGNRGKKRSGLFTKLETLLGKNSYINKAMSFSRQLIMQVEQSETAILELLFDTFFYRLKPNAADPLADEIISILKQLQIDLLKFLDICEDLLESVSPDVAELPEVFEYKVVINRMESYAAFLDGFMQYQDQEDMIFWIEKKRNRQQKLYLQLVSTPLEIATVMKEAVIDPYKSVVFTSATLSVNSTFDFWKKRVGIIGLQNEQVLDGIFPSPFDYKNRVLLGLPTDAPNPQEGQYTPYVAAVTKSFLHITEGKGLVLFTSRSMLNEVYQEVKPFLSELDITCYRQGDDDRFKILENFKENRSSVLFATNSFWEGVDSPGDTLQIVIICRLPFTVPSDPIQTARMEHIEQVGGNSFLELSLPEAVMRLKQGFGRLMRRTDDKGIVVILDPRITRKHYGKAFINSLPETQRTQKTADSMLYDLEQFLYE